MKKFFFLLVVAITVGIFSSCDKEGTYNPKQKISTISSTEEYNWEDFQYKTSSVENWNWDKNLLKSITSKVEYSTYSGGNLFSSGIIDEYTYYYLYDGKNRLIRIEDEDKDGFDIIYDGNKISKIQYEDLTLVEIEHNGDKVSQVKYYGIYYEDKGSGGKELAMVNSKEKQLLRLFLPQNLCKIIAEKNAKRIQKGEEPAYYLFKYEWKGKNVDKITAMDGSYSMTCTYTYDNKKNPFNDFIGESDGINGMVSFISPQTLSTNNVLTAVGTYSADGDVETETMTAKYKYEKNYPIEIIYSYDGEDAYTYSIEYK